MTALHADLTNQDNVSLVMAALDKLRVELKNQEQVVFFDTPPLLQTLVTCLTHSDDRVRSAAAMLICQLTANNKPAGRYVSSFPGVMDTLTGGFGLLNTTYSEQFGWALAALASAQPVDVLSLDLPRLALLALASPDSQLVSAASWLIFNLCNNNVEATNACAALSALSALLDVAAAASRPPATRELAMRTLGTMVCNVPALAMEPRVLEYVPVLCSVIAETDDLALQAMWLVAMLIRGNARVQAAAGQWSDGALFPALGRKLLAEDVTVAVAQHSLSCLFELTKKQPEHQLRLVAVPGFDVLLLRLLRCTSERVQGTAAALMAVMVSGQPALQTAMADAVAILVDVLVADNTGVFVQEQSVTALYRLCDGCSTNISLLLTASNGRAVDTVCALLVRGHINLAAQANALMLLRCGFLSEPNYVRSASPGFKDTLLRIGRGTPCLRGVVDSLLTVVA